MSPSRGAAALDDAAPSASIAPSLPPYLSETLKRPRQLSFQLDSSERPRSRAASYRRASEIPSSKRVRQNSSNSSWTASSDEPVASSSQQPFSESPERHDNTPLAPARHLVRPKRSASELPRSDFEQLRRPASATRSFTMQPGRKGEWELSSTDEEQQRATLPRRKQRERARSLHVPASAALPASSALPINGRHTRVESSTSSPSLARLSGSPSGKRLAKDGNEALPRSPSARMMSFETRKQSIKGRKREASTSRPRPLSEQILPNSTTHGSLADIASAPPVVPSVLDEPTPKPHEPTLQELIAAVPLEQALSLYQSVNKGTQRALNEQKKDSVRPMTPLSNVQSAESSSQKGLLSDSKPSTPEKHQGRERRKSLALTFGKAKKSKEKDILADMPPLTPTLTQDRALRTPGERQLDDEIAHAHLQTSPVTFARANECRNYLEARYTPVYTALHEHRSPPSLLEVSRWRGKMREEQVRMQGLAASTSTMRTGSYDMPLVAGKPLPHRNKRTRDFEVYPDEMLAFIESCTSPKPTQSPVMMSPAQMSPPGRRRQNTLLSEHSDQLHPLPRQNSSASSVIYPNGRMSDRGSTTSLTNSRHRSPSVSSAQMVNGVLKSSTSPPNSPLGQVHNVSTAGSSKPVSRIGSVKANLARKFHRRENTSGHRSSGSDAPVSPYMTDAELSEVEGAARLRHSSSKAGSAAGRGWRNFRPAEESLHRIEMRNSMTGSSHILGSHISDAELTADLGSFVDLDMTPAKPPLTVLDIDDEEEERLESLLGEARLAITRATAFAPRCPSKIASYLESLSSYDLASRVAARRLTMPPLIMPILPPEVVIEVERAARAERILHPAQTTDEEETYSERESDADKLTHEPRSLSPVQSSGGSSSDSEDSNKVLPPARPRRTGPLRRQSLAEFHPRHASSTIVPRIDTTARSRIQQRRMTVATTQPKIAQHAGIRPDPLPGVHRTLQAFELAVQAAKADAQSGLHSMNDFHERATMANREASEAMAELAGSTTELSRVSGMINENRVEFSTGGTASAMWALLSFFLGSLLRGIGLAYTLVRIVLLPLRLIWAIICVVVYGVEK